MNSPQPPWLFHRFFRWFCKPSLRNHIEGDLLELYSDRVAEQGKRRADLLFIKDVIFLLRPRIIRRPVKPQNINHHSMLKNYFKISWRNLRRNRSYAAINITGLSIGVAACLLIFLVIRFETSFDNFHKNSDHIYRIVSKTTTADGIVYKKANAFPIARGLKIDYPQLENVARILIQDGTQVTVMNDKNEVSEKKFKEDFLFFADPVFFNIFNFPLIAGNAETALSEPNTVLLTQQTAEKYFGDWHGAINRYIKYQNFKVCKVTGILKNTPVNTDFPLQVVFSFKTTRNDTLMDWVSQTGNLNTFVVLPKNVSASQFDNELEKFAKRHTPAEYARQSYALQPLNDIHYNSQLGTFRGVTFSHELITTLSLIGIFLLIIACVNFINLATAQAVNRSKEVGVRKVLGSRKINLILQFLTETFIITVIAVVLAFIIAYFSLPFLNRLLQTSIQLQFDFANLAFLVAGIIIVALLSGFYPAIILSGFNPITVLKGKLNNRTVGGLTMRRVLVVFQFVIAQALIIGTLVVVKQMNFFRNTSMGFDKEEIITVGIPGDSLNRSKIPFLKQTLLQQPGIKYVSFSAFSPADNSHWGSDFKFDNSIKSSDYNADLKWADADYFKTYNIKFIAGRPYGEADTATGFVVNNLFAQKLGFKNPADIIGKKIDFWDGSVVANIIGVVEDFHSTTLAKQMQPAVLASFKDTYQLVNIKLQPQNVKQTLSAIEKLWTKTYPDHVYGYQFLDDKIASFYKQEEQISQLYKAFAAIAIFISCLGLYGLVSFMAVQRTKEVGIRKVLGASVGHILYLFSKEFTLLIALAFVIAAPGAWYFMHEWLQNFAYRTGIGPGIFILTILIAAVIAWITVGYRAIKAAMAKPVNSLRTE